MRTLRFFSVALLMITMAVVGCSGEQGSSGQGENVDEGESTIFVGKVVETMDVNTYTYVRLEHDGESVWAAGPKTSLAVGDELAIDTEMYMLDFYSETLDRTFERLHFVNELTGPHAHDGMDAHGAGDEHVDVSAGHGTPQVGKDGDFSGIEVPEGGLTVAEVWTQRNELAGQEIVVRGRVTKYNSGIMGRNWIHLQDGRGSEVDGPHDLVVTTDAGIAAGNIITIRGTVALDQDFGSGYKYPLLVEKASIE